MVLDFSPSVEATTSFRTAQAPFLVVCQRVLKENFLWFFLNVTIRIERIVVVLIVPLEFGPRTLPAFRSFSSTMVLRIRMF